MYRALRFANASGEWRPLSKPEMAILSRLACAPIPLGLEPPLFRNGLRLAVFDETGMVALRLDGMLPAPPNRSSDGAGEMVVDNGSVDSGTEGRAGFCGASCG